MSVARVTELSATSETGSEDAINEAVASAKVATWHTKIRPLVCALALLGSTI